MRMLRFRMPPCGTDARTCGELRAGVVLGQQPAVLLDRPGRAGPIAREQLA